jgi:hypothetical protein
MGSHNWVKAVIHCSRHRRDSPEFCVLVDRDVPQPLRCTPSGGGGLSSVGDCACVGGGSNSSDLPRQVADALRNGIGQWIRLGHVVIEL